jgi:hypothetical protein
LTRIRKDELLLSGRPFNSFTTIAIIQSTARWFEPEVAVTTSNHLEARDEDSTELDFKIDITSKTSTTSRLTKDNDTVAKENLTPACHFTIEVQIFVCHSQLFNAITLSD